MRKVSRVAVGSLMLVSLALLPAIANAQGVLTAAPAQLTVTGTRGVLETRTLLLRAAEPVAGLQVVALDLAGADGRTVLPARAIRATLPAQAIAAGGLLTVSLTFDLRGAPSGAFAGELLLSYQGGALSVPVNVMVKDPWPLPLAILIVGVGLGVVVSAYRARGRPRDQVLVRVGQLRAQMRGDADLAAPFRVRIEACLVDVETALQAENWQEAQNAAGQAEVVWVRWRKGREDWLEQLKYHAELVKRLENEGDVPTIQALRQGLEDVLRAVSDLEGPDKLHERLDGLAQQANRYFRLRTRLDELNTLRGDVPGDQAEPWRLRTLAFQRRLDDLRPDDDAAYQTLQSEVEAAVAELTPLAAMRTGEMELGMPKEARGLGAAMLALLSPAPVARPLTFEERAGGARVRLRWFTLATYAIAVLLLAGAGFGELYVANAAFGANAWGDYFALLAWGFGAEATRAAVAQMVRNWGLPGVE